MRIRLDLSPRGSYAGETVILIDVLRSCTVAAVLFDNGLDELLLGTSLREARRAARERDLILVGDRAGVPPEGFNYSSSPATLRSVDFAGRSAAVVSENAPRAVAGMQQAGTVFLGSLYNAGAVARAAAATGTTAITLVCSGFEGQEDLDDALAGGFLAAELVRLSGATDLDGATKFAIGLMRAFPEPIEALWHSTAGRRLRALELTEDLAVASMISQSRMVPRLAENRSDGSASLSRFVADLHD